MVISCPWQVHIFLCAWITVIPCLYMDNGHIMPIQGHVHGYAHTYRMLIPSMYTNTCMTMVMHRYIHSHIMYIAICAMQLHTWTMVIPDLHIVKFTRLRITLGEAYTEYAYIYMKQWSYRPNRWPNHVHFHQRAFTCQSCLWLWQSHFRHNMALQLTTINTVRQTKKRRESIPQ